MASSCLDSSDWIPIFKIACLCSIVTSLIKFMNATCLSSSCLWLRKRRSVKASSCSWSRERFNQERARKRKINLNRTNRIAVTECRYLYASLLPSRNISFYSLGSFWKKSRNAIWPGIFDCQSETWTRKNFFLSISVKGFAKGEKIKFAAIICFKMFRNISCDV